ncbi:GNAT family N-acetyltransferase [Kitasatospora sp. NPDC088134]|uniref:GNAT family N-acetyltransferase n=1 Tax=Kitasatospora sp. NPDC088134 TaxID=3364071 RepID=UPI00382A7211
MPSLVAPAVPPGSLAARPQPTLRAGRDLLLRPWSPDDAPAVLAVYQDPEIQRWHVQRADSLAEAAAWIADWHGGWAAESGAHWAVTDARTDALLGRAALKRLSFADGSAELAYWTAPAARGRGSCPRAVEAVVAWAFGSAGFQRLGLQHAVANTASCRVAEKTGFAAEGVLRSAWQQADGRHDVHVHARIRA